jgi:hypothetical protein
MIPFPRMAEHGPSYKLLFSHRDLVADLIEPDLPEQLRQWQPQIRYLLLDKQRLADTELAGQRNVAAALFRLENSRRPEDIDSVLASLIDWLAAPEQDSLRRAFVVWLKRVLRIDSVGRVSRRIPERRSSVTERPRFFQHSMCSAMSSASSTSTPK